MLNINATLLFQILNFIILILLLNRILFKPLLRMYEEREALISGKMEESRQTEEETARMRGKYQAKINEARLHGRMQKEQLRAEALMREKVIVERVRSEKVSVLKNTQTQIEHEMKKTREELTAQIQLFSSQIVKNILGREVG